jgi:hypothetical protein
MNTFDSSAPPPTGPRTSGGAEDNQSSSRSHTDSALSSSFGSTRSHSSSSSRKNARNQNPLQNSSQSNESTPINTAGPAERNYQSTVGTSPSQLKDIPPNNENGADGAQPINQAPVSEPKQTWYGRLADQYGSLELENKGSVARDHLALGTICAAYFAKPSRYPSNTYFLSNRTNVPSLDAHLPSFRFNRHRSNTTLPPEQRYPEDTSPILRPVIQLTRRHPPTTPRLGWLRFSRVSHHCIRPSS